MEGVKEAGPAGGKARQGCDFRQHPTAGSLILRIIVKDK